MSLNRKRRKKIPMVSRVLTVGVNCSQPLRTNWLAIFRREVKWWKEVRFWNFGSKITSTVRSTSSVDFFRPNSVSSCRQNRTVNLKHAKYSSNQMKIDFFLSDSLLLIRIGATLTVTQSVFKNTNFFPLFGLNENRNWRQTNRAN
jgi:hypothetical protein